MRGIFLLREKEIKWFYQEGASHIFPEEWDLYTSSIPKAEQDDFVSAYGKRLRGEMGTEGKWYIYILYILYIYYYYIIISNSTYATYILNIHYLYMILL